MPVGPIPAERMAQTPARSCACCTRPGPDRHALQQASPGGPRPGTDPCGQRRQRAGSERTKLV